ncbi:MAG: PIN domain-containing protein [Nitrososphaerales archaeon]
MNKEPSGNIIFDTGTLLEIVSGSALGAYAKDLLKSSTVLAFTNELHLGELRYLICRKSGEKESEQALKNLTQSGYLRIAQFGEFVNQAADMKCRRSVAFADCFALAMGETMHSPVLFATREAELLKEIKKQPFRTNVIFLDELARKETSRGN